MYFDILSLKLPVVFAYGKRSLKVGREVRDTERKIRDSYAEAIFETVKLETLPGKRRKGPKKNHI